MFLGTHYPRLDDKGRFFLPAKFRPDLADGLIMTKGQENCLYVFTREQFAATVAGWASAPVTDKRARDYLRVLYAGANDEVPDKQGRVMIPAGLRTYAGLVRDCAVVGAGTRLEIWDAPTWEAYLATQDSVFSEVSEEVLPGVI